MNYDVGSITDHWDAVPLDGLESRSLRAFGSAGRAFSGGLDWSTSGGRTSALVVNGFAVRATRDLPSPGEATQVERVREAPAPVLPYLVAVHGRGKQRLRRYTENQPIETTIDKLSGTSFTGYVELSDRVYSGDYYAAFHAGRPGFVALRSDDRPPLCGDDARERMVDEVGIYTVHELYVDPVDLSAPPDERGDPVVDAEPPTTAADEAVGDTRVFDPEPGASADETGDDTKIFETGSETDGDEVETFRPDRESDGEPRRATDPGGDDTNRHDVYCKHCGNGVDEDAFYCPLCGGRLD